MNTPSKQVNSQSAREQLLLQIIKEKDTQIRLLTEALQKLSKSNIEAVESTKVMFEVNAQLKRTLDEQKQVLEELEAKFKKLQYRILES